MNNTYRLLIIFIFQLSLFSLQAQTVRDYFKQMPDSLMPYLTTNNRLDMIDFLEAGMKSVVTNRLDGETEMLYLSDDSLSVRMSKALLVEMSTEKKDTCTVILLKRTLQVSGDRAETILTRYDGSSWQKLSTTVLANTLQKRDDDIPLRSPFTP